MYSHGQKLVSTTKFENCSFHCQTLILDVFSTAELESGVRMSKMSKLVERYGVFPSQSLGKTSFRCIAHAGQECTKFVGDEHVDSTQTRAHHICFCGAILSCVCSERLKSVSPKNLREGEDHQTCTKPIQIKLYHVRRVY